MGDGAGVDLTVISPSHSNGAATLLFGDVNSQNAVAEHRIVEVQVALLLLIRQHLNGCKMTQKTEAEVCTSHHYKTLTALFF